MIMTENTERHIEDIHTSHCTILSMILELEAVVESLKDKEEIKDQVEDLDTLTGAIKSALYDVEAMSRELESDLYKEAYRSIQNRGSKNE